jgi:hypothetical protein
MVHVQAQLRGDPMKGPRQPPAVGLGAAAELELIADQICPWFLISSRRRSSADNRRWTFLSRSRAATTLLGLSHAATSRPSSWPPAATRRLSRRSAWCLRACEFRFIASDGREQINHLGTLPVR